MNRPLCCFLFYLAFLPVLTLAEGNPALWRGSMETDQRLLLQENQEWAWNENRLDLTLEKRQRPLQILANIRFRHFGPSLTEQSADLFDRDKINPWNLDMRELFVSLHGFLLDDLDVKIGRQQIAWGTADRFNPTNNLNPYDLEDVLDFGRVMGSDAINVEWHTSFQSSLQVVYIMRFQPAAMPLGVFSGLFDLSVPILLPQGEMLLQVESDELIMPRNNFSDGSGLGIRWKSFAFNTDYSFSYIYRRDPLPLPEHVTIALDPQTEELSAHASMMFPRHHILGADFAGTVGRTGIWGELAVFVPESKAVMNMFFPDRMVAESRTLLDKPYLKFVLGADYTFAGGSYLNVQYLRGFLHERGRDELNDYLFIQTERYYLQNRLRIQPLAGGFSISDRNNPGDHHSWIYSPEVSWLGMDNLEISLGGFFFGGKGGGILAGMKDFDMVRLQVKANF